MSAWNDIQDHLDVAGKTIDSFDVRYNGGREGAYTRAAEEAREHIKRTIFELEAKADERDYLRKMLSESRAEVTSLELSLERLEDRWEAALDERVAEIEKSFQDDHEATP